jgi:hypothetical protein
MRMVEVGPRDGLQNEARRVPVPVKIALIERLAAAGLRTMRTAVYGYDRACAVPNGFAFSHGLDPVL